MPSWTDIITLAAGNGSAHDMLVTMAVAIAAGALLIVIAHRIHLPAIVLLLVGGVLLGIGGEHALVNPDLLGDGLSVIVSLAVGLILFEGGLTLDITGYRAVPAMIKRLLTIGVITTWLITAGAIWLVTGTELRYAVLAASLVIVTGPTVIAPLLKRIQVKSKLHSILHWEGVLIDPIGVFLALLTFEYVVSGETGTAAAVNLGVRVAAGLGLGVVGGLFINLGVRRKLVPEGMINVFALAGAVLVFGVAEMIRPEAGLLAVTVAGFVFGLSGGHQVKQVRRFKAELTDLLIGMLFILLSARLTFDQFTSFGLRGAAVVAIVIFFVRPLSIAMCSFGLDLTHRERIFLAWVAPRGIVAASMASLFAISMVAGDGSNTDAQFVETFAYSVIISTIILHGSTAVALARFLGLKRPDPTGWLIVGCHAFARRVAAFIAHTAERPVVLMDTNARSVRDAQAEGFNAIMGDARDVNLADRDDFQAVGYLLALTDNEDLNIRLCQSWRERLGTDRVFRCNPTGVDASPDDEEPSGRIVWPKLPRPSLIAAELQRAESRTLESSGAAPAFAPLGVPILTLVGDQLLFDPPAEDDAEDPDRRTLYLQRTADYLLRSIRPELIVTIKATALDELFRLLVDRIISIYPSLPRDDTVQELLDRETGFPTALGHGVAVPHTYSSAIDSRVCAVARVPDGIDYHAPDNEPVRLIFLVLSPQGDPEGHLATLAEIARRVIDPEVRERLINAVTPAAVVRAIRETRET